MKIQFMFNQENRIIGYRTLPLRENAITYEIDEIPKNLTNGEYSIVDGVVTHLGKTDKQLQEEKEKYENELRAKREPLIVAFDKWEKAVLRGREVDDPAIMTWYQNLKDLKESAFENIPDRVDYYLQK